MEVVLGMPFLIFNNTDIQFAELKLIWKSYTAEKTLPITPRVEVIDKKEFAKAALNKNIGAFVIYVSFLSLRSKMTIYAAWKAQIASLLAKKVTVPAKYSDFANVFSKESAKVSSKRIGIKKHAIELEDGKQPPYEPIYTLGPITLETLKTYIKTNLVNGFI